MQIERVGVIGAGTMGSGIAQVFARCGFPVLLCELEQRFLDRGLETIKKNLERELARGQAAPREVEAALGAIRGILDRKLLADAILGSKRSQKLCGQQRKSFAISIVF